MAPKVLFVLTSHDKLGDTGKPTGWYLVSFPLSPSILNSLYHPTPSLPLYSTLANISCHLQPEFAHPYEVLADHVQVVVASPNGGAAPLDPSSVEAFKGDASATKFLNTKEALWKNTHKLSEFIGHANDFEAIFFVGGHGRTSHSFAPPLVLEGRKTG
jgi:hypothetical protein